MKKAFKAFSLILALVILITASPLSAYAKVKAPAKPTSLTSAVTDNTVTLKWKKVSGAKGYVVYSYNKSTKKYAKKATTTKTSYKHTKLKVGTSYNYAVKSYKVVKGKKYYSKYSAIHQTTTLSQKVTKLAATTKGANTVSLSWQKESTATSYRVYYSQNSAFKNAKYKTVSSNKLDISGLALRSTYYFRVYSVRSAGGKQYLSAKPSNVVSASTYSKTTVNADVKYQTINGFGASAAWWAKKVGGWDNADDFIKLLYSDEEGIGLNIYRYNLGAGTDTDDKVGLGARAETFIESIDGTQGSNSVWSDYTVNYDWSRDANAQRALSIADKYADNLRVVLFANSPPKQITKNGKGYCSYHEDGYWDDEGFHKVDSYKTNLERGNFELYAKYLTDCADHFIDEGYNVVDVSPVNEPQYSWSCDKNGYMSQEGCYYTPADVKALASTCAIAGKDKPYKFSIFESCGVSGILWNPDYMYKDCFSTYLEPMMTNNTIKNYYDTFTVHSYWNSKEDKANFKKYMDEKYPKYKIACTEYCQMTNDINTGVHEYQQTLSGFDFNGMGMEHGIELARTVMEDLTVLNATEWSWWTALSGGYYPDGLVYYDEPNLGEAVWNSEPKEVHTSKRLWCLGNYSKFIKEGAVRISADTSHDDFKSCAFMNKDNSVVVVYINSGSTDVNTSLELNSTYVYNQTIGYLTDENHDLEQVFATDFDRNNRITIPAKSVLSVIVTNNNS